tara:strand:+ start:168 stop:407 length:240 start_codon:yes stop_codon:yes gene_type:complete
LVLAVAQLRVSVGSGCIVDRVRGDTDILQFFGSGSVVSPRTPGGYRIVNQRALFAAFRLIEIFAFPETYCGRQCGPALV